MSFDVQKSRRSKAETSIKCGFDHEDSIEIGFNGKYVQQLMDEMAGNEVYAHFDDAGSPAVFFDPATTGFKAVLMPMRV